MGEHHLHGFRVAFDELVWRTLALSDYFLKGILRTQLDILSVEGPPPTKVSMYPSVHCAKDATSQALCGRTITWQGVVQRGLCRHPGYSLRGQRRRSG